MSRLSLNALKTLLLAALTAGFAGLALSGCNTTAGMGEDIEAAGDAIEDKAEDSKGY